MVPIVTGEKNDAYISPWFYLLAPPIGGALNFVVMITVAELTAALSNYYTGSLPLPYFSDLARDGVPHQLLSVGLSLSCALFIAQHCCFSPRYAFRVRKALGAKRSAGATCVWFYTWLVACGLCCLSSAGLLLSVVIGAVQATAVHQGGLMSFFLLLAPATCMMAVVLIYVHNQLPSAVSVFSMRMKLLITVLYWPCLLAYLLILFTLPMGCKATQLSLSACIGLGLGEDYCESYVPDLSDMRDDVLTAEIVSERRMLANATDSPPVGAQPLPQEQLHTTLSDYSSCPAVHTVRVSAQLVCLLLAALFHGSFVLEEAAMLGFLAHPNDASADGELGPLPCQVPLYGSGPAPAPAIAAAPSPAAAQLRRTSSRRPRPTKAQSFAEEQLNALYDLPNMIDPEEVRAQLPPFAAGALPPSSTNAT